MSSGLFVFDIETLSIESTSVILSACLLYVDPSKLPEDNNDAYKYLYERGLFVKLKVSEQIAHGRTMSKDTLDWWAKQGELPRKISFIPAADDLTVQECYNQLSEYFFAIPNAKNLPIWVRGSMDQPAFESLLRAFNLKPYSPYNNYRDIRTAISILYSDTEKNGYVEIPNFNSDIVMKHDPVADCCLDALMLLRGKQE